MECIPLSCGINITQCEFEITKGPDETETWEMCTYPGVVHGQLDTNNLLRTMVV